MLEAIMRMAALLTIYNSFLRPHLDYGYVIYDRTFNDRTFQNKSVQCNAALAITGAIRGSSREKHYQELGLKSLEIQPWYQNFCLFFKVKTSHPSYLLDIIPQYHQNPKTKTTICFIVNMKSSESFFSIH